MATITAGPVQDPQQDDPNVLPLAKPKTANPATSQQVPGQPLQLAPASNAPPTPTVAAPAQPVDRVALATQTFDNFAKAQEPIYKQSLENVTGQAAGLGQLGSGQWRTGLRDEANRQQLELATQRDSLINKATEGSIADAQTAYQQALANSQQGLAAELGRGNLSIAQQSADTAKAGTLGQLALGEKGLAQSGSQFNASLDLQKKAQDIDAAYKAGTMTLAEKDQALRDLENQQQYGLAGEQLQLAKTGQAADIANQQGQLALAQSGQAQQASQFGQSLAEQTAARLQSGSQFDRSLEQSGDQFKASLAQNAQQFGLSQDQQMALAKLSDATANRSIDASTAQGKNALLVQLAQILGGPTGTLNPTVLAAIAKAFGVVVPGSDATTTTTTGVTPTAKDPTTGDTTLTDDPRYKAGA